MTTLGLDVGTREGAERAEAGEIGKGRVSRQRSISVCPATSLCRYTTHLFVQRHDMVER